MVSKDKLHPTQSTLVKDGWKTAVQHPDAPEVIPGTIDDIRDDIKDDIVTEEWRSVAADAPEEVAAKSNNMEDKIVMEAWKTVVYQPETPELVADMVLAAGTALRQDEHYQSYRTGLAKLLQEEDSLKPLLHRKSQEAMSVSDPGYKEKKHIDTETSAYLNLSSLIDDWISELLRFLAMKLLLVKEPIPSICIRASWKALMLFPTTYDDTCKAMGSSYSAVDCDHKLSKDQKNEFYTLTKLSYKVLFDDVAPLMFWPSKPDEAVIDDFQENLAPGAVHVPSVGRNGSNRNEMAEGRAVVTCIDHDFDDDFVKEAWKRVVHQPDASEVVQEMVFAAGTVLQGDVDYLSYRTSLVKMLEEKDSLKLLLHRRTQEVIMNKNASGSKHIVTDIKSSFIDDWIGELLRFLAMKALIAREPIPSICIRAAWQTLVQFPTTYSNICEAMGSSNTEVDCVSELSKDKKNEFYTLTMLGYGVLFGEVAPLMFWPSKPDNFVDKECLIDLAPRAVGVPVVGRVESSKETRVHYNRGAMSSIGKSKPSGNGVSNTPDAIEYGIKYGREEYRMFGPSEPDYIADEEPRVRFTPGAVNVPSVGRRKSSANIVRKGKTSAAAMHSGKYAAANDRYGTKGGIPDAIDYDSDCGSEYSSEDFTVDDTVDDISLNPATTNPGNFVEEVKWAISDFVNIFTR